MTIRRSAASRLKADPSQTYTLRKRFETEIKRRFNRFKSAILDLVKREDAFGLTANFNPSQPRDNRGRWSSGGGKSIQAVPKGTESGGPAVEEFLEKLEEQKPVSYAEEEIANVLTRKFLHKLISEENGKVVGALAYKEHSPTSASIEHLGSVSRGTGGELVRELQDKYTHITTSNTVEAARGFYEKLGFKSHLGSEMVWEKSPTTNTRWKFRTNPAKVEEFRKWLQKQAEENLIQSSESTDPNKWWDEYVLEAYRKGQLSSFESVNKQKLGQSMDFYKGTKEQFLRDSFAQPETKEKIQLLAGRVFTDLKGVTEAMATVMTRTLTDGLSQGQNPFTIARQLVKDVDSIGVNRARMIARTEVIRAHAEGQLDALETMGIEEVGVAVEWHDTDDSRVCPLCTAMDGVVLTVKEAHGMIPRHPNAVFAGSSFIPYGECQELVRAWYRGPSVILTLRAGLNRTTIGPNHPVMTRRGMITAAELCKGDEVLYDYRKNLTPHSFDFKQVPPIEDIFETLCLVGNNTGIVSSTSDLHGDREFCQGEVQAIYPTNGLLRVWNSFGLEQLREIDFTGTNSQLEFRPCIGSEGFGLQRVFLSSSPLMSKSRKLAACVGSKFNSHSLESEFDSTSIDFESLFKGAETFPIQVTLPDFFKWEVIHDVSFGQYEGLAFDATTATSLYCSGGLVVSNCRCAFMPANVGESKIGQIRGPKGIQKAINKSIQREIPKGSKRSLAEQKQKTKWGGADTKIIKKRPKPIV